MEFITIYSSPNPSEISIIRNIFEEKGITYKILDEVTSGIIAGAGVTATRVQVKEEDRERAKEILVQSGFLGHPKPTNSRKGGRLKVNKWVLVFLAAIVLVIVALLITWFMNAS